MPGLLVVCLEQSPFVSWPARAQVDTFARSSVMAATGTDKILNYALGNDIDDDEDAWLPSKKIGQGEEERGCSWGKP